MPDHKADAATRDDMLAQGEAGLFFVEALALKLMEMGVLDADQLINALENARSSKAAEADEGPSPQLSSRAAAVLVRVMNSVSAAH